MNLASIEVCAGGGGMALGLESAGFAHNACVEYDSDAIRTLTFNRPEWNPIQADLTKWSYGGNQTIDLLSGGVPCPPFSKAGKQLGSEDERDLFPEMLRLASEVKPRAIMIENVRGLLDARFDDYRQWFLNELLSLGYTGGWELLKASDFGVPQLRPRSVLVAFADNGYDRFEWPKASSTPPPSVGNTLHDLMSANGWRGATEWANRANDIAPTLVGGSRKHGGPDLGPTRARKEWAEKHGVEGKSLANAAPDVDFVGMPRLTIEMTARLQGFPTEWEFCGTKTSKYRQIGNAFPPPVAKAVGQQIAKVLG